MLEHWVAQCHEYINFTYVSRIVDQAQSIPFIKLIPKGEENVSLLRRIESRTYLLITKRLLSTANSKRILSMSKSSFKYFDQYEQINQYFLIQELNNVLNTYKVIIIKGATE